MQVVAGGREREGALGEKHGLDGRGAAGDDREGAERGGEKPWQARRAHGRRADRGEWFAGVSMQAHAAAEGEEKRRARGGGVDLAR